MGCSVINRDRPICHIVRQTIGSNLNWDYILENALENGTSSLLYRNLKEINDDGLVPRLVIKKLKDIYYIIFLVILFS